MAQLIVRNLEKSVRDRLLAMAARHGRSMEEEVREILRAAALRALLDGSFGLGTRLAKRFRRFGIDREIDELRGEPARAADLDG